MGNLPKQVGGRMISNPEPHVSNCPLQLSQWTTTTQYLKLQSGSIKLLPEACLVNCSYSSLATTNHPSFQSHKIQFHSQKPPCCLVVLFYFFCQNPSPIRPYFLTIFPNDHHTSHTFHGPLKNIPSQMFYLSWTASTFSGVAFLSMKWMCTAESSVSSQMTFCPKRQVSSHLPFGLDSLKILFLRWGCV